MKTSNLSKFNNAFYKPGRNAIIRSFWYLINLIFFRSCLITNSFIKKKLLKLFGAKIGANLVLKPNVNIKYPWNLEIGNNVWIGESVWLDSLNKITIDDNVCISQGAFLLCGSHDYKKESFDLITKPIYLEEGTWICAKAIVSPGVRCKSHSVLSLGSIATRDLEKYTIYQGNPAKPVRNRIINE
ncbi:MAG: WcaF family extracellular polysaccharide biosynthesis acetyltransferase [Bacteroidota bacterium]|nr:WcaF family extracellular polysaccharide biosynthesis acetyltransferase [Bacteroidota bacterium]MEC8739280.1 WcaF family extracellular polysaccharide biosynthesis acetyltransferase [Bacteroidota bacterium]